MLELGLTIIVWFIILRIATHYWAVTLLGIIFFTGLLILAILGILGIFFWKELIYVAGAGVLIYGALEFIRDERKKASKGNYVRNYLVAILNWFKKEKILTVLIVVSVVAFTVLILVPCLMGSTEYCL